MGLNCSCLISTISLFIYLKKKILPEKEASGNITDFHREDECLTVEDGQLLIGFFSLYISDPDSDIKYNQYKKGHQQHMMNISLGNDATQLWINNPGEYAHSGENRPSYWAGNGKCPLMLNAHH